MTDERSVHPETRETWNTNAAFWDEKMGEGNDWHLELIVPSTVQFLDLTPGHLLLDAACGNGLFSRRMAQAGVKVMAFDFSEELIERAKARTDDDADIDYRVIDATDRNQLLTLGERKFDAAVCNMALFDMTEIEPLISCLSRLLKKDGRFVFSVVHPCFNSGKVTSIMEQTEQDGEVITEYSVKISSYATPATTRGQAIFGQPAPQYYFHRSLSQIFNTCFDAGFILDRVAEPVFKKDEQDRSLRGNVFREIPPVLVARMRLLGSICSK